MAQEPVAQPGPWRLIPGRMASGRPYLFIGRDKDAADPSKGIDMVLTDYSRTVRRWFKEEAARDALAYWLRLEREAEQKKREAALARELSTSWPFPVSAHDWSREAPLPTKGTP